MNYRNYLNRCSLVLLLWATSCVKDGGFYEPPEVRKEFAGDTYEYLQSKPGVYDSLLQVIDRLGMESTLRDSAITLFAVPNQGFQLAIANLINLRELADRPAEYLSNVDYAQLDTMVTQYIINGVFNSDSLTRQDGVILPGIRYGYPMHARLRKTPSSGYEEGGPEVIEFSNTKHSQFLRDWVTTLTGSINVQTSNAVVHVLNPDHVFGFDEFTKRLTYNPPPPNLFELIGGTQTVSREHPNGADSREGSSNVLDGNPETKFFLGGFNGLELTYELNEPAVAGAYTLTSGNDFPDRDPTDWNLQGSVDGSDWEVLDTRSGQVFEERFQIKIYRFNNTTAYKFYRLTITRNNGSSAMQFADWTVNQTN